eukprot:TRINITY_DN609_c0_g3_i1.p1 TRINITY_DN609_c0_g3~~TRINITY_DN609_c0_g3_i1.p1  ORF type:complete len:926 (+),score=185.88 TRINITY_DN609_c0_g3_i1:1278-4055(+)
MYRLMDKVITDICAENPKWSVRRSPDVAKEADAFAEEVIQETGLIPFVICNDSDSASWGRNGTCRHFLILRPNCSKKLKKVSPWRVMAITPHQSHLIFVAATVLGANDYGSRAVKSINEVVKAVAELNVAVDPFALVSSFKEIVSEKDESEWELIQKVLDGAFDPIAIDEEAVRTETLAGILEAKGASLLKFAPWNDLPGVQSMHQLIQDGTIKAQVGGAADETGMALVSDWVQSIHEGEGQAIVNLDPREKSLRDIRNKKDIREALEVKPIGHSVGVESKIATRTEKLVFANKPGKRRDQEEKDALDVLKQLMYKKNQAYNICVKAYRLAFYKQEKQTWSPKHVYDPLFELLVAVILDDRAKDVDMRNKYWKPDHGDTVKDFFIQFLSKEEVTFNGGKKHSNFWKPVDFDGIGAAQIQCGIVEFFEAQDKAWKQYRKLRRAGKWTSYPKFKFRGKKGYRGRGKYQYSLSIQPASCRFFFKDAKLVGCSVLPMQTGGFRFFACAPGKASVDSNGNKTRLTEQDVWLFDEVTHNGVRHEADGTISGHPACKVTLVWNFVTNAFQIHAVRSFMTTPTPVRSSLENAIACDCGSRKTASSWGPCLGGKHHGEGFEKSKLRPLHLHNDRLKSRNEKTKNFELPEKQFVSDIGRARHRKRWNYNKRSKRIRKQPGRYAEEEEITTGTGESSDSKGKGKAVLPEPTVTTEGKPQTTRTSTRQRKPVDRLHDSAEEFVDRQKRWDDAQAKMELALAKHQEELAAECEEDIEPKSNRVLSEEEYFAMKERRSIYRRNRRRFNNSLKIKRRVQAHHCLIAQELLDRADVIFYPHFGSKDMSQSKKVKKVVKRSILSLNHFELREILKRRGLWQGKAVIICTEEYSSMSCAGCGHLYRCLYSKEHWKCPECEFANDRDITGSVSVFMMEAPHHIF